MMYKKFPELYDSIPFSNVGAAIVHKEVAITRSWFLLLININSAM